MPVLPRQFYGGGYGSGYCTDSNGNTTSCNSRWNTWGRWVALGVILVIFFILFYLCSAMTARRRKRQGLQPYYGTGWVGNTPFGHGRPTYNPNARTQEPQVAPPAYGQNQSAGGYYGASQGYFGGQQTGTEMEPPQNVYHGADNGYAPPAGPPPGKGGDGIIR